MTVTTSRADGRASGCRGARPATAIPDRFNASCAVLPDTSCQSPNAKPNPTLPAAGTVVTEMNTPDRPPSFDDVSDSIPAAPAITATMNDHLSGE